MGLVDLLRLLRPEEVAERIASGKLDMRPEAVAERREALFPETFYSGSASPDILENAPTNMAPQYLWASQSPGLAASYAGRKLGRRPDEAPTIYPLAVNTEGFDRLLGDYRNYNSLENPVFLQGGTTPLTMRGIGYDTDGLVDLSYEMGSPGLLMQDIIDPGPYQKLMNLGVPSARGGRASQREIDEFLQELERNPPLNMAVPDTTRVRAKYGAAFDPDYTGPNILGGAAGAAALAGLLAAPQEAEAGPLSRAAKIAALRKEANAARFGDDIDVSYRGQHVAPNAEYGAPLHDLTSIIPEDVYGPSGQRLYGLMDRAVDDEAFAVLRAVRGKPDAEVTMYRAVPSDAPDTIADGDWVTTSRTYAEQHGDRSLGGDYKILEEPTYARRLQSEGYPYEFGYMKNGKATVPMLAATAAGTGATLAAPGLVNMASDEPLKKPTAGDILNSVFHALDMPMAGLQGLVRTGYGLAAGESLLDALAEGVHITQQGPDYGADRLEKYITEKTGDPSLGWMGKMGLLFGAPF